MYRVYGVYIFERLGLFVFMGYILLLIWRFTLCFCVVPSLSYRVS